MDFVTELMSQQFLQLALLTSIISGAVCGLIGPLVVTRKLSSVTGGIAHSLVGGMGFFVWLGKPPLMGALFAAIFVALVLSMPKFRKVEDSDSRVQILWSVGMALGILFISKTPGYGVDLMSYLFGNLLLATHETLILSGAVLVGVLAFIAARFRILETMCFDEDFASVIGLPVRSTTVFLYLMIALSVVVLIQSVGLILVISLMTIPASLSLLLARSMFQMMLISIGLSWTFSVFGLYLSFVFDLPTGSAIILCAGFCYLCFHFVRLVSSVFRSISQKKRERFSAS